jgi:ATP-binding cassette subfamily B protein AbcA/BmrA
VAALVAQQTFMFDDTVRGNVTLGEDHDDEAVWRALNVAQGAGFVERLPEALDTQVGERGASLSGGQRQRFTVARALLRQPDYLLLDEATAAMDIEGKDLVWTSIRQRMAGKTVVFVAHDAQTVRNADYIIVLRDGKAEAAGDRDTMLASNPYCLEMMEQTGKEAG